MPRVICLGSAVLDGVFFVPHIPTEPVKTFAHGYTEIGGGPAATGSVAVRRLGGEAMLWSRVGADPVGRRIIDGLAAEGVDVSAMRAIEGGRSTVSAVLVDDRGERLITSFNDPDLDPDPGWLPLDQVASADSVLVDGRWPAGAEALLRRARDLGVPSVLDADLTPESRNGALSALASHTIFSHPALTELTGEDEIERGLLAIRSAAMAGVTAGARGFFWIEDGAVRAIPAPRVPVVDTLGAGDVFHGAFALGLAEGMDVAEAGRFATAAASLKCQVPGGRAGVPGRAEVDDFLATDG